MWWEIKEVKELALTMELLPMVVGENDITEEKLHLTNEKMENWGTKGKWHGLYSFFWFECKDHNRRSEGLLTEVDADLEFNVEEQEYSK